MHPVFDAANGGHFGALGDVKFQERFINSYSRCKKKDPGMPEKIARLMTQALSLARDAMAVGDHPYGSVITRDQLVLGERNRVVSTVDPTAHSETMAVRSAAREWGLHGVAGATLITTYEPCPMCLGAILEAGVTRLVIGMRREVGPAPLGEYTVETLLHLLGRSADLRVESPPPTPELAAFYQSAG